jgi:hypothetical protein
MGRGELGSSIGKIRREGFHRQGELDSSVGEEYEESFIQGTSWGGFIREERREKWVHPHGVDMGFIHGEEDGGMEYIRSGRNGRSLGLSEEKR